MSKKPTDTESDFDSIKSAADAAAEAEKSRTPENRLSDIEAQIAKLEPLLEQKEQNPKIATTFSDYIDDLKAEQKFLYGARWTVGCLALIVELMLISILALAIFHHNSPLLSSPPAVIAAVVLGLSSGIVFLINSLAKGTFRSASERHSDGFVPPTVEEAYKLWERLNGKVDK